MAPCCKDLYTIPGSWKHPSSCMTSILTTHVTHWACLGCSGSVYTTACSSSCQYPATSHSHWRGVDQHPTGHNQQADQLYVKEMCCTAWGKWWSHQILTGFRTPPDPKNKSVAFIILVSAYIYITVVSSCVVQPTCINGIIGSLKTTACPKKTENLTFY